MNTAIALNATLDTNHIIKALESLDSAYAAGLPRGNRDIEAEIMLFSMADQEISADKAIAFSYRLSAIVASAQTASITAEMLEAQKDMATQLAATQVQLKEAITFIRDHNLLEEFNRHSENPVKVRGRRKTDSRSADAATPASGESVLPAQENDDNEQSSSSIDKEPLEEPSPAVTEVSPCATDAPEAVATLQSSPEVSASSDDESLSWGAVIAAAENGLGGEATEPGENTDADKDMFRQLPSAFDFLSQEEFIVSPVDGIFNNRAPAENVANRNSGMQIFEMKGDVMRIVPGGGAVLAGMPGGQVYVVAAARPKPEIECLTYKNFYMKNPGYVSPVIDEEQ